MIVKNAFKLFFTGNRASFEVGFCVLTRVANEIKPYFYPFLYPNILLWDENREK